MLGYSPYSRAVRGVAIDTSPSVRQNALGWRDSRRAVEIGAMPLGATSNRADADAMSRRPEKIGTQLRSRRRAPRVLTRANPIPRTWKASPPTIPNFIVAILPLDARFLRGRDIASLDTVESQIAGGDGRSATGDVITSIGGQHRRLPGSAEHHRALTEQTLNIARASGDHDIVMQLRPAGVTIRNRFEWRGTPIDGKP